MKKLILALVLALAACAPEIIVVTSTPVPPTATLLPPTATPIPPTPTITPEPWDAEVSALDTALRQLPDNLSQVIATLPGGTTMDLLAVTEDKVWVQATAYLGGGSAIRGWIKVDTLRLNVSLDDLAMDTETALVTIPTRVPAPTSLPLNERFIDYFAKKGFVQDTNISGYTHYSKRAGRGFLMVGITNNDDGHNPVFGFISRINATQEERDLTLEHLDEAASFIDPVDGINMALSGMQQITTNTLAIGPDGTWRRMWADGETWAQFIHTSTGQEVYITYIYEEENVIKVFFTYLPVGWQHPTE